MRWTAVPVYGGLKPFRICEPAVVSTPFTHSTSFTAIGIPASGPAVPSRSARSAACACSAALAVVSRRKALTSASAASIRSRCRPRSSCAESSRSSSMCRSSLIVRCVGSRVNRPLSLFLYRRHAEEPVDGSRRVGQSLLLGQARARHVLAQRGRDLDHLRGRWDRVGVELLQPVDVAEDAAQLLGVEILVAGLEAKPREQGDVANLIAREWHWKSLATALTPTLTSTCPSTSGIPARQVFSASASALSLASSR